MTAADVINMTRILTATPAQAQGRWSDANIISIVDMAQKHLVQELLFPESRLITTAVGNQQYYPIPETHRIFRVYLNGEIVVETPGGIDTLEGRQIGLYDDSTQGVATNPGSDGPSNAAGSMQPNWVTQTPVAYPFLSSWGSPAPITQPAYIGMRPRYYRRGGGIGFVPAPANTATMTIDCVLVPPTVTNAVQILEVPSNYLDTLAWYATMLMKFADDTQANQDQRNFAEGKYQENLKRLRTWVRQYSILDDTTFVRNDRWRYSFGGHRSGEGNW